MDAAEVAYTCTPSDLRELARHRATQEGAAVDTSPAARVDQLTESGVQGEVIRRVIQLERFVRTAETTGVTAGAPAPLSGFENFVIGWHALFSETRMGELEAHPAYPHRRGAA